MIELSDNRTRSQTLSNYSEAAIENSSLVYGNSLRSLAHVYWAPICQGSATDGGRPVFTMMSLYRESGKKA